MKVYNKVLNSFSLNRKLNAIKISKYLEFFKH